MSWLFRLAKGLACLLAAVVSWPSLAQPFGRFGYTENPAVPGFTIDKAGFVPKYGASEKFYFAKPATTWKILQATDVGEDIDLGFGALSVNLYSPGFMVRFPKGFALNLLSTSAPYLSWKDASVGEHVPTPDVRWIAVSFRTAQPPIVLGFMDGPVSLQLDGRLGDWTLHTSKPYTGWVRIALAQGTKPLATDSAASLGKLSLAVAAEDSLWWQPAPALKSLTVSGEDTAVEATWLFDRKGAVVPVGATLARLGSYPLEIKTKIKRLDGYTEEGPATITDEEALTIRFPVHRIPLGRPLIAGAPLAVAGRNASGFDIPAVVELALENLSGSRSGSCLRTAESCLNDLIQNSQYTLEPHTNQRLPFGADGKGIDVTAAGALLWQTSGISTKADSIDNSLLTSVTWRRDWYTWRIWAGDSAVSRRAGAFAAVAGAMCSEPDRRLEAGMDQAGLAAERGLGIYLARAARQPEDPKFLEPIWEVRNTIFDMEQARKQLSPFAESLYGMVRVYGSSSVQCTEGGPRDYRLQWTGAGPVTLASGFPLVVAGDEVATRDLLGYTTFSAPSPGVHTAVLTLPPWAKRLPVFVAPPPYDEPVN